MATGGDRAGQPFAALRHRSEQYFTWSHTPRLAHFLRFSNGLPQVAQIFVSFGFRIPVLYVP